MSVAGRSATRRVVVIGAGVGGLSAAWRLAEHGFEVTVYEQAAQVGGKLGSVSCDGFTFDTGPHLVTWPEVFTGLDLALRRVEPGCRYRWAGSTATYDHVSDAQQRRGQLEAMKRGNGAEMDAFLGYARRVWNLSRDAVLERPLRASLLARRSIVSDLATIAPWRSLEAMARRSFSDQRLVDWACRFATYSGSDPRRAPAALSSIAHLETELGAWYVEGGLRRIAQALVARCTAAGVQIVCGANVEAVRRDPRGVSGVVVNGEFVASPIVVANCDATELLMLLDPELAASPSRAGLSRAGLSRAGLRSRAGLSGAGLGGAMLRARVRWAEPSSSGFVMLLGIEGHTPELAHHNVFFPADYHREFDDLFGRGGPVRAVTEPAIYVSRPPDPAISPPGCESWFVLVNAPNHAAGRTGDRPRARGSERGIDWDAPGFADAYGDRVLGLLAAHGHDVTGRVRVRIVRTPADLARATRARGGSIYGTSQNGPVAAFLRPPNRVGIDGLYLVGGSAHPGGGLPLVIKSAEIAVSLITTE